MADKELSEEIQLLRKQLSDLQKQQEAPGSQDVSSEEPPPQQTEETAPIGDTANTQVELSDELTTQFRELLDSIDKDIKDAKPTTLLIVFALGVLVGRL